MEEVYITPSVDGKDGHVKAGNKYKMLDHGYGPKGDLRGHILNEFNQRIFVVVCEQKEGHRGHWSVVEPPETI